MSEVVVIPTRKEQVKTEAGAEPYPANIYMGRFGTNMELSADVEGLKSLPTS
ncbi:hypothetical protein G6L37_04100 [Agrobacterium rubi]|nr:hypothetical protein [Agrobacterium rubi]NTF24533.1 hypothetical protein [Agrobacterium rubi]